MFHQFIAHQGPGGEIKWPKGCNTFKDYVQYAMLNKEQRERVLKQRGIEDEIENGHSGSAELINETTETNIELLTADETKQLMPTADETNMEPPAEQNRETAETADETREAGSVKKVKLNGWNMYVHENYGDTV